MKPKKTLSNTQPIDNQEVSSRHTEKHLSWENPMLKNPPKLADKEKVQKIEEHFKEIMEILGLDLTHDSLKKTPRRIAKMFVYETFSGLNTANRPKPQLFKNTYQYDQMLVEKDITFYSYCEHHFVPFYGRAHVAYFPMNQLIGLSKINRIVQYYAKRPQVQERLTVQIGKEIERILDIDHVAVVLDANHLCVSSRGVGDTASSTGTAYFNGKFKKNTHKKEFLNYINDSKKKLSSLVGT